MVVDWDWKNILFKKKKKRRKCFLIILYFEAMTVTYKIKFNCIYLFMYVEIES